MVGHSAEGDSLFVWAFSLQGITMEWILAEGIVECMCQGGRLTRRWLVLFKCLSMKNLEVNK